MEKDQEKVNDFIESQKVIGAKNRKMFKQKIERLGIRWTMYVRDNMDYEYM